MITDLVIPALNEVENIDPLFDGLDPLRHHLRHVIVADNGSTDGTGERAATRGAVVVREARLGYGAVCLKALDWIANAPAPPDAVCFLDADCSEDPAALPVVLQPLVNGRAEIVIGSRVNLADPGALNLVQRYGNALACALMAILGGRRYHDLGPFRAVRWATLQRLQMADRTWGWTVEMQMKAALLNIDTVEVEVPYHRRPRGRSKISGTLTGVCKAGHKIIWTIVALWWRRAKLRAAAEPKARGGRTYAQENAHRPST